MPRAPISLTTLQGFEAAARLESFAAAADELHLSHSAVSHQIKQLESELNQPLFRRVGRSVVLTDAGKDFARTVRDTLARLNEGVARLAPYKKPASVILYTTVAFARGFVVPRLGEMRADLPDIDLWLDTSQRAVDFDIDEVDILITAHSGAATAGVTDTYLMKDERVAIAAPRLIDAMGALSVDGWPLLHDEGEITWRDWLTKAGLSTSDAIKGRNFSDEAIMLDAAAAAHGAALGSRVCADPHLRSGALKVLDGPTFPQPDYRMYCDLRHDHREQVHQVSEWLAEAARSVDSSQTD